MKEELLGPKVENVAIALVQMINEEKEKDYYVYLINLRDDIMEGIIVAYNSADSEMQIGLSNFLQDRMMAHKKLDWMLKSIIR